MKVLNGETKRLIISIPPRHLKSICTSVALPAWVLGQSHPSHHLRDYANELAVKHANDTRAVMASDWYANLFPATKIASQKNTETKIMTTKRGFRFSTSVGGTLTGRGGNLIIVDDPIKPADAMSDTTRERVNEWCGSTLMSRLDDKERDAIVLVMQRLHEGDRRQVQVLPSALLEKMAGQIAFVQTGPNNLPSNPCKVSKGKNTITIISIPDVTGPANRLVAR